MNIRQNTTFEFLYQKKATLPSEYISEFHKYWKKNHEKVMLPKDHSEWEVFRSTDCPPEKEIIKKKLESLIPQDRLIFRVNRYCIFSEVCQLERKILNAPNSISIEGRTGWKSGKTNEGGGRGISS